MRQLKLCFFILCLLTIATQVTAQYPLGFLDGRKGKKKLPRQEEPSDTLPIPLYDKPGGKIIKYAKLYVQHVVDYSYVLMPDGISYVNQSYSTHPSFYATGYQLDLWFIKYYEIQNGFVKVLAEEKKGGLWIDQKDIEDYMAPTSFIKHLVEQGSGLSGYTNYRLRDQPTINGNTIITLNQSKHLIKEFTGKIEGNWAEAIIYEVNYSMLTNGSRGDINDIWTKKQYKGWIRLVDENGQIKGISYNPTGC